MYVTGWFLPQMLIWQDLKRWLLTQIRLHRRDGLVEFFLGQVKLQSRLRFGTDRPMSPIAQDVTAASASKSVSAVTEHNCSIATKVFRYVTRRSLTVCVCVE